MLNKIIIMGRLTRDPELRRTGNGTAVTSFSLAVDRDFKSQSGEKETDFIDVVAWRGTAEFVSKYFTKEVRKYVPTVMMTVVDTIPQEEIENCRKICEEEIGATYRVRAYIAD